jgi:hypothetical protein
MRGEVKPLDHLATIPYSALSPLLEAEAAARLQTPVAMVVRAVVALHKRHLMLETETRQALCQAKAIMAVQEKRSVNLALAAEAALLR